MYLNTITKQIKTWIPELTTLFSKNQSISTISVVSGLATVTTSSAHNLSVGDYVYIKNAKIPIKISSITKEEIDSEVATITTSSYHDQTEGYTETVEIDGVSDSKYNGDKTFITDIDGYNYTIEVDSTATQTPDVTNAYMYIHKYQTINGWKKVLSAPTDTTFTYQDNNTNITATINNSGIILIKNQRIFNCLDFQDSMSMYCNSYGTINKNTGLLEDINFKNDNELTMFVCLDPNNKSLVTVYNSIGFYEYMIHLYIYKPMKNSYKYLARDSMSFLETKVLNPILGNKTLASDDLHNVTETETLKFLGGNKAYDRNEVLYVHSFTWSFRIRTNKADLDLPADSVRFNKIDFNWTSDENSGVLNEFIVDY